MPGQGIYQTSGCFVHLAVVNNIRIAPTVPTRFVVALRPGHDPPKRSIYVQIQSPTASRGFGAGLPGCLYVRFRRSERRSFLGHSPGRAGPDPGGVDCLRFGNTAGQSRRYYVCYQRRGHRGDGRDQSGSGARDCPRPACKPFRSVVHAQVCFSRYNLQLQSPGPAAD